MRTSRNGGRGSSILEQALRAKGWSHRDAGREVLAVWRKCERRDEYPTSAAIAVKLGRLLKGDSTWWINQVRAFEALAELLHCKPDDLLPVGTERLPAQIQLPEFPELAGILPGQTPCSLNPDGWLGTYVENALQHGGRWWFYAPAGAGKSLAVRVLRERWSTKAIVTSMRTLFEAAREAKDGLPLVIEVDYIDVDGDAVALAELSRRSDPTCILAGFQRPTHAPNEWTDWNFELHRNWREQLVGWVRSRVPVADRLDVDAILTWFDETDPSATVFRTPGEVITILARIYRAGIPSRGGLGELASEWLSQTLGCESDAWLRRLGRDAVEHLVGDRLRHVELERDALAVSTWADMLPASLLRSRSIQPTSSSKRGTKKTKAELSEEALTSSNAREAIHALADKGVLRTGPEGGLDVFPNWVRVGLERAAIHREVRSGNAAAWGMWANDASRKDAVDDALDALGPNELVRAASKINADDDLASVAASEALFSAFGRRFLVSAWQPIGEAISVLQSLGLRQLRLLDRNVALGAPLPDIPLTRHRANFQSRWQIEWRMGAWAFSFAVPRPSVPVSTSSAWRLPGWTAGLLLGDAPKLPYLLTQSNPESGEDDHWILGVLRAVRPAVRACRDDDLPDDIDLLLLPWLVIDGPPRGWRIGKKLAASLMGTRVLEFVRELLRREPVDVATASVTEVWRALLQVESTSNPLYLLRALHDGSPSFYELLTACLPVEAFTAAFVGIDLLRTADVFTRLLLELPDRLNRVVIRMIADQARATGEPIWNLERDVLATLGREYIDLLIELASERYSVGSTAAERVWSLDGARARDEGVNALVQSPGSASTWFYAAPSAQLSRLLDEIDRLEERPPWVQRWLATVLSRAGAQAPRVFSMLTEAR